MPGAKYLSLTDVVRGLGIVEKEPAGGGEVEQGLCLGCLIGVGKVRCVAKKGACEVMEAGLAESCGLGDKRVEGA